LGTDVTTRRSGQQGGESGAPAKRTATLYTIGYEGRSPDELLAILSHSGVTRLADVRQMPLSRKPGFSKSALSVLLESHGMEYFGFPKLGTPAAIRDRYKNDGDFVRLRRGYLAHLRTQESEIGRLYDLVAQVGCALLCFERDPTKCHRSILAAVVAGRSGSEFRIGNLGFDDAPAQGELFGHNGDE
jgi:uncharacterized protein (DUF488 family)